MTDNRRSFADLLMGKQSGLLREQVNALQSALDVSEQRFRALVEDSPVGIVVSTFEGSVVYVNNTLVRLHGYDTKQEFVGSPVEQRYSDVKDRNLWVSRVWDQGKLEGLEIETKRKDGSLFWSSITACALKKENGEQEMVVVVEDVTNRRTAEEALRRSELRYSSLFAHMLEGFAYCRMIFENGKPADFQYLEVNERFKELTGLAAPVGKKVSELIPGVRGSNPELFEIYGRVASGGSPERFETYIPALRKRFSVSAYTPGRSTFHRCI